MNRLTALIDYIFAQRRWIIHVFFWLTVLLFYSIFFGRKNNNYTQTAFFVSLLMPVTIGTTYFLNYCLVPFYLMRERYGLFFLYAVYTLLGSLFFEMLIAMLTFIVMAGSQTQNMSPPSFDLVFLLTSLLMVVFLGVAVKMVLHWRQSKEDYQKLMREKVETELKFLKTQLNPHFLFNTLNNLYYLSTEKSERTPEAILALSEILDYVLNSSKSVFVPLKKELQQVNNYISLELLRYDDRVLVEKNFSGDLEKHRIGPMILITLIENAFKHGVMPTSAKSWIKIDVKEEKESLVILIKNSSHKSANGNRIGLSNLQNQLEHLYKEKHSFHVIKSEDEFSVSLILKHSNEI
jgi:sensor histidine kinase YesM